LYWVGNINVVLGQVESINIIWKIQINKEREGKKEHKLRKVQREGEKCRVIPFSLSWEVRMPYNTIWILLVLKEDGIL